MKFCRFVFHILLIFAAFPSAFAQTSTVSATESKEEKDKAQAELEKKAATLVDRTADDAALLKLPENRAFVLANAADLLWQRDEKRARQLFRDAAEQLILAQTEFEKSDRESPHSVYELTIPRQQILQKIARRDADLALELLIATRSAQLTAELQKSASLSPPAESAAPTLTSVHELKYLVQNELLLEQSFATLAAENNPQRAVKLIRESLAKNGVTFEVWRMLEKLHQKDEDAAKSLLGDVVAKLLATDLAKKDGDRIAARVFLFQYAARRAAPAPENKDAGKKAPLKPDEQMLREVAGKIVDAFLQADNFNALYEINGLLPTLERLTPERLAAVRQKQAALKKTIPAEQRQELELWSNMENLQAAPAEKIKNAAKMPSMSRSFYYQEAVSQMVKNGDGERARQLLAEAPGGSDRDQAIEMLDYLLAQKAIKEGKFDEARKTIGKMKNKSGQIQMLVGMARAYFAKNTKEEREIAVKLMEEARRMIDHTPEDAEEINALLTVVAGYALIEPERAFTMLTPLVEQTNDLLQAVALLSKFNKGNFSFRRGEISYFFALGQMQHEMGRFSRELGLLAAVDFERTRNLTAQFARQDTQIYARLLLARSILQEKNDNPANSTENNMLGDLEN